MNGRIVSISFQTMVNDSVVEKMHCDWHTHQQLGRQPFSGTLKEMTIPTIQAEVGLLIGADVPKALEPLQVVNSVDAVRIILGLTVNGPLRGGSHIVQTNTLTGITTHRISVGKIGEI